MKMLYLAERNKKEILRDPLTLFFGLGFPIVVLLLLSAIQANIPVPLFEIENLAPGISVFGLSFMTLFAAQLLSRDRESAFIHRLYTTPLTALDFIFAYLLPLLPISLLQTLICYLVALPLGLPVTGGILLATLGNLPIALFFITLGLFCGSLLGVKAVGGLCGTLVTNLTAFLSGIWFDVSLVGAAFEWIARLLPFWHGATLSRMLYQMDFAGGMPHALLILGYALVTACLAVFVFLRQMKKS